MKESMRPSSSLHRASHAGDEAFMGDLSLHRASYAGDEALIGRLLQRGQVDVRQLLLAQDEQGDTPLHLAAKSGKEKAITKLLNAATGELLKACVSAVNKAGRTPLHYAAASGNSKAVALLLDGEVHRAVKDVPDKDGFLPFHFAACDGGDTESLDTLVPENVNMACKEGLTPLHLAAVNGKVNAVKKLLERGAILTDKTDTPLHLTAISKSLLAAERKRVVEAILRKFPDSWRLKNKRDELAIGCAYDQGHDDVVGAILGALREHKFHETIAGTDILDVMHGTSGATLLHYAAACGVQDDITWLEAAKAMMKDAHEFVDNQGFAPLHWAARKGNISTLKALTAAAQCDLIKGGGTDKHETPLFLALERGHLDFAEELLMCERRWKEQGKRSHSLTSNDWMAGVEHWIMALYRERAEEREQLESAFKNQVKNMSVLKGGELITSQEIPPVYLALDAGKPEIAKFFHALSDDAVNKGGRYTRRTALHWAVLLRKAEVVEQLAANKALPLSEKVRLSLDVQGRSAIEYAKDRNMQHIEALLFKLPALKDYIDGLYSENQIYVNCTNAILVTAALIASVTFASWLQPPLGFTDDHYDSMLHYVAIRRVRWMRIFWVFNSLSFFAAVGTGQACSCGLLLLGHVHITRRVNYMRHALTAASVLMAFSVFCVLCAFGAAGFIVLPPKFKFEVYMTFTVIIGGLINVVLLFWFIRRIFLVLSLSHASWKTTLLRHIPHAAPTENGKAPTKSPSPEEAAFEDPLHISFPLPESKKSAELYGPNSGASQPHPPSFHSAFHVIKAMARLTHSLS